MMYLAIDTSSDFTGLALVDGGQLLAEFSWRCGSNHTVELLPHIDSLLTLSSVNIQQIKGIIVAVGPGSFNGLRVGLGTAKGLAFSLGIPVAGVNTLEAAAYQHSTCGLPVRAIFNAGRNEVASAAYQLKEGKWVCLVPASLTTVAEICSRTAAKTVFCGDLTITILEQLRTALGENAVIPPAAGLLRRPGFLASLGEKRLIIGEYDDADTLQPLYLRPPHISPPKSKGSGAMLPSRECAETAVIWDMDGTIVNTASKHFDAWKAVFSSRAVAFSRADFKRNFGLRNGDIIKEILGEGASREEIELISREKNELFREGVRREGVSPMPGAVELLTALHGMKVRMAVASSAPTRNINTFIEMLNIAPFFNAVVSGEEVKQGKPAPDIFLLAAKKLNVEPACCAVIEDAVGGIAAATDAGMCSVGVAANHPKESLQLANIVVDSLAELKASDVIGLIRNRPSIKLNNRR
jgi:tRNA threonylcarbamoyl adenosine modification protein YeaZ